MSECIGLIDVDGTKFPNLALMKLSAHHKRKGDTVHVLSVSDVLNGIPLFTHYDRMFGACVFEKNREVAQKLAGWGVEVHGSGIDSYTLLDEIEREYPDYSLYGITDTAYGFLTRGCPRQCPFCIVAGKEGTVSHKVANLSQFWFRQKYVKLLDPNLLACDKHMELLGQLVDSGAWIDFTQGLDVRLLTPQNIEIINQCKIKMLHFAWDNPKDGVTKRALLNFREQSNLDYRRLRVYVLTNYWSTHQEDLYRVYWLRENGYDPYIMVYDKPNAPRIARYLQRWVNNKFIFRSVERFEDYDNRIG